MASAKSLARKAALNDPAQFSMLPNQIQSEVATRQRRRLARAADQQQNEMKEHLKLAEAAKAVAAEIGVGAVTLHQLRLAGAGIHVGERSRSLEGARRRGCWAQAKGTHRREHCSRPSAKHERHPEGQRRLRYARERHVLPILPGLPNSVRLREAVRTRQARGALCG
ncbi:unnamed protein product [Prorocentrum cordatum]|uniref:Uncharacterized protein n=1 Tax=Prorocentrum cordatum TaxID=2364126 RepID=A0ABN9WLM8_9DINO|nr:unnamed protein product [Polarella glacialis]